MSTSLSGGRNARRTKTEERRQKTEDRVCRPLNLSTFHVARVVLVHAASVSDVHAASVSDVHAASVSDSVQ